VVFEVLKERWILKGTIRTLTSLHVGRGRGEKEAGEPDLPVLRFPDGKPYIPGSSLKGAIRSELDRLTKGLGFSLCIKNEPRYSCAPPKLCVSCILFGSTEVASRVIFRDAVITQDVSPILRVGTAITRDSKKVVEGSLFETEYLPPNSEFDLEMVFENPEPWMIGLLAMCIESLQAIGGQVSRGAGKVEFKLESISIYTPKSIVKQKPDKTLAKAEIDEIIKKFKQEFEAKLEELKSNLKPAIGA